MKGKPPARRSPYQRVLEAAGAIDPAIEFIGDRAFRVRCPAGGHGGDRSSLSLHVTEGEDGRVLLCCKSHHCDYADVMRGFGQRPQDGFGGASSNGNGARPVKTRPERIGPMREDSITKGQLLLRFEYQHLLDVLVHECLISFELVEALGIGVDRRWDGHDGHLRFVLPIRDQDGRTVTKVGFLPKSMRGAAPGVLAPKSWPRWALALLDGDGPVVVCEAELDAVAVRSLGFNAYGCPGASWSPAYTVELVARGVTEVVVVGDRDEPGQRFNRDVVESLTAAGIECPTIELPEHLGSKGDIRDLLAEVDPARRREVLQDLIAASRASSITSGATLSLPARLEAGMHFVLASSVEYVAQRPLLLKWGQRIPKAELTLILGREGRGKTLFACQVAADVTRESAGHAARDVLFLSSEDSKSIMAARLEGAGADLERVHLLDQVVLPNGRRDGFRLPRDRDLLEQEIKSYQPALLVIGGSLMGHIALDLDGNSQIGMRAVLEPLHDLAERYEVAVLIVVHPNKSRHADAGQRVHGSTATIESARSALLLEYAEGEDGPRALAHFKHSNSAKEPTLLFDLDVVTLDNDVEVPVLVKTGESDLSAGDLLNRQLQTERKGTKREEAVEFLEGLLAGGEWHPSSRVKEIAANVGISDRTLKRAVQDAEIEVREEGDQTEAGDPRRATSWRLPASRANVHAQRFGREVGPTGPTRIPEPNPFMPAPQSGQTPGVAPLETKTAR